MTHYWNKTYRELWLNPCKHSFEIMCIFQESGLIAEIAFEKQNRIKNSWLHFCQALSQFINPQNTNEIH